MSGRLSDEEFNIRMMKNIGISENVLNYLDVNENELLNTDFFSELYKSNSKELQGFSSDEIFKEVLFDFNGGDGSGQYATKGLAVLFASYQGYTDDEIMELYNISYESMYQGAKDEVYSNWDYEIY